MDMSPAFQRYSRTRESTIRPRMTKCCGRCGAANAPLRCGRCLREAYCDKNCQGLAWTAHKAAGCVRAAEGGSAGTSGATAAVAPSVENCETQPRWTLLVDFASPAYLTVLALGDALGVFTGDGAIVVRVLPMKSEAPRTPEWLKRDVADAVPRLEMEAGGIILVGPRSVFKALLALHGDGRVDYCGAAAAAAAALDPTMARLCDEDLCVEMNQV